MCRRSIFRNDLICRCISRSRRLGTDDHSKRRKYEGKEQQQKCNYPSRSQALVLVWLVLLESETDHAVLAILSPLSGMGAIRLCIYGDKLWQLQNTAMETEHECKNTKERARYLAKVCPKPPALQGDSQGFDRLRRSSVHLRVAFWSAHSLAAAFTLSVRMTVSMSRGSRSYYNENMEKGAQQLDRTSQSEAPIRSRMRTASLASILRSFVRSFTRWLENLPGIPKATSLMIRSATSLKSCCYFFNSRQRRQEPALKRPNQPKWCGRDDRRSSQTSVLLRSDIFHALALHALSRRVRVQQKYFSF